MIQEAKDAASARASLMVHLDLTERQADAVLAMPLRRLTGLEQESLRNEAEELRLERERLQLLLQERDQLLDAMVQEEMTPLLETLATMFSAVVMVTISFPVVTVLIGFSAKVGRTR